MIVSVASTLSDLRLPVRLNRPQLFDRRLPTYGFSSLNNQQRHSIDTSNLTAVVLIQLVFKIRNTGLQLYVISSPKNR